MGLSMDLGFPIIKMDLPTRGAGRTIKGQRMGFLNFWKIKAMLGNGLKDSSVVKEF